MSTDHLMKLQVSRQQKTIDQADLIMGRMKPREDEEMDDIELMEAQ